MKKILIITDTWTPDINGVVTSIARMKEGLEERGVMVRVIHPREFRTIPLPFYRELRLGIVSPGRLGDVMRKEKPDYIHIATPGTLGFLARIACMRNKWKFTMYYHTRLPEYVQVRTKIGKGLVYWYLRWFHRAAEKTLVSAPSLKQELEKRGFKRVEISPLGVDVHLFSKNPRAVAPTGLKHPIFVFLGRIAPEKNIGAFLECDLPGTKLVIGDGPARQELERRFSGRAVFVGYKTGQEVVDLLSVSDVFVFPSKTDTFGLVMLEAMACDLPVAAFDVPGPKDVVTNGVDGYLGDDLAAAAMKCLELGSGNCRKKALEFSWEHAIASFMKKLIGSEVFIS